MNVSWDSRPSTNSCRRALIARSRSSSEARRYSGVAGVSAAEPPMNGVSTSSASGARESRGYLPRGAAVAGPGPAWCLVSDAGHGGRTHGRAVRGLQREVAGGHVTRAERAELGLFGGTDLLRVLAPGPEPAPRRRVHRAGQLAADGRALLGPLRGRLGHRDGGDQAGRVRVRGALVDVLPGAELDQLAQVHDADPL